MYCLLSYLKIILLKVLIIVQGNRIVIISKETAAAPTVSLALKWIRDVKMKPCSIETYFYTHKVNGIITVDTTYLISY